jgi:hypothetical protein
MPARLSPPNSPTCGSKKQGTQAQSVGLDAVQRGVNAGTVVAAEFTNLRRGTRK